MATNRRSELFSVSRPVNCCDFELPNIVGYIIILTISMFIPIKCLGDGCCKSNNKIMGRVISNESTRIEKDLKHFPELNGHILGRHGGTLFHYSR